MKGGKGRRRGLLRVSISACLLRQSHPGEVQRQMGNQKPERLKNALDFAKSSLKCIIDPLARASLLSFVFVNYSSRNYSTFDLNF